MEIDNELKEFKTTKKLENENNSNIKTFEKIKKLQLLLKKESSLKELCKYKFLILKNLNLIL